MHLTTKLLVFCLTLCCVACIKEPIVVPASTYSCENNIENTHPNSDKFDAFLDEKVVAGIPGMTMLIETPAGIWAGAAGVADIPNNVPMQTCNVSRVGSITKTFTASLILKLVEKGQLDLSDKISEYLAPEIVKNVSNAELATIEQLLSHTSGITDYSDQIAFSIDALNDVHKLWTALDELSYIYGEPAAFAPNAERAYSNSNYVLLGLIAESITGKSGATLLQEEIFTPLELTNTSFNQKNSIPENLVRGYSDEEENGTLIDRTAFTFAHSSMEGGAVSSVADLRTFIQAAMTPNVLFSETMIKEMTTVKAPVGEDHTISSKDYALKLNGVGLGWFNMESAYGLGYGHGGSLRGYQAFMVYFPERETTICYLINGNDGQMDDLEDNMRNNELVSLLFEE